MHFIRQYIAGAAKGLVYLLMACVFSVLAEEDKTIYINTTVTGSYEQPTVSYIIPWQSAAKTEAFQIRLGPSFLDNTFKHLELEELEHELALREQIKASFEQQQAAPMPTAVSPE